MNSPEKSDVDLDLGDSHWLKYFAWSPDRSIQSNAERYAGIAAASPSLLCRACGDHGFIRAGS